MPESSIFEIFSRTEIPKSFRDLNDVIPRERELDVWSFQMRLRSKNDFGGLSR